MPDPNQNTNGITSLPLPGPTSPNNPWNAMAGTNGAPTTHEGYTPSFDPGAGSHGDQTGGKFDSQSAQNYASMYNQAQGMASYFNNQAANYNQVAPQIGDQARLGAAADYYTSLMQGDGGYAQRQYMQNADQGIAAQMAMANSARGGAAALAGAQRAAQMGAGAQMATAANQAAQIASQEEQAGAQGLQGIGTLDLQRASNNAQLQQNNQQQINQMQQALFGMGEQEQGLGLSAQQAYMANLLAAEGINTQQSQFNTQLGMNIAGAGLQTLGTIGAIGASDERLKTEIQPQGGGLTSAYAGNAMGASDPKAANLTSIYSHALNTQPQAQLPDTKGDTMKGAGMGAATGAASGAASGGPIGALLGGAGGALQGGLGAAAHDNPHDQELHAANTAASAGIGAASGAATGAAFGGVGAPIGALIGGGIGLIKGLMT